MIMGNLVMCELLDQLFLKLSTVILIKRKALGVLCLVFCKDVTKDLIELASCCIYLILSKLLAVMKLWIFLLGLNVL